MIRTSNYKSFIEVSKITVSISRDSGEDAGYIGDTYLDLAPEKSLLKKYHKNIGVIPEYENVKEYTVEYWNNVLSKLDPEKVYNDLNNKILLCYEKSNEFCHRHLVAAWLEILLEKEVPEIEMDYGKLKVLDRPEYIKEMLEEVMRENQNMNGYSSLRALYLHNKGQDEEAKETEEQYKRYIKRKTNN